jgi:hypothetical protein
MRSTEPSGKVRFASDDWLLAAEAIIEDVLATSGIDVAGHVVRCSEVFTATPPDLPGRRRDGSRAWHWELEHGRASVGDGERDAVDLKVFADYEAILPLARDTRQGEPDPHLAAYRDEVVSSGKLRMIGDPSALPEPIRRLFAEVHARLARVTA